MTAEPDYLAVLDAYPGDLRPTRVDALGSAGGFSGAMFWQVRTPSGLLCLRRWPADHPSAERLEFIQAVLWHVVREGFELVPLPLSTRLRKGYVCRGGHLWELAPWMPGKADFRQDPNVDKLEAAMVALAEFHRAAATFPLPDPPSSPSPGIRDRLGRLRTLLSGELDGLAGAVVPGAWPELERRAERLFRLVPLGADRVLALLETCSQYRVSLQPCIRDVWHDHVLFEGDRVTGLIDFGSMATDNVAADVARLLGSMARDDDAGWEIGLEAYGSVRALSEHEISLAYAFDQTTVLMAGLTWVDWIYRQGKIFDDREAVLGRVDDILGRLEHLSG
jgi:homoserine kinase type II